MPRVAPAAGVVAPAASTWSGDVYDRYEQIQADPFAYPETPLGQTLIEKAAAGVIINAAVNNGPIIAEKIGEVIEDVKGGFDKLKKALAQSNTKNNQGRGANNRTADPEAVGDLILL